MNRTSMLTIGIATVWLALLGGLVMSAQNKYTVKVPGGHVIEGAWEYEIRCKQVKAKAGDVLFVPAGAIHSAKNVGTGKAVELATYIVEQGRPLLTLVK